MDNDFLMMILALLFGSVGSVLLASFILLFRKDKLQKIAEYLTYLAGGTLLGAAFLGMIPNAISKLDVALCFKLYLAVSCSFFYWKRLFFGERVPIKTVNDKQIPLYP